MKTPIQPRQIRLDTATICNATCLSCHRFVNGTNRQGVMPIKDVVKLLENIAKWKEPLVELVPINYGEFFCHQSWYEILEVSAKLLPNTRIVLPTNGLLLHDKIDKLCSIPTLKLINFSINAYYSSTYEAFMGLDPSNINNIMQSVITIRKQRPDMMLWASMVFDPAYQTDAERDAFVDHWKYTTIPQIIPAANCNRYPLKIVNKIPCRSLFSDLVIGYDGKLSSCCFDAGFIIDVGRIDIDNLKKNTILEAWKNQKLEFLRKIHNGGNRQTIELCKRCSFG